MTSEELLERAKAYELWRMVHSLHRQPGDNFEGVKAFDLHLYTNGVNVKLESDSPLTKQWIMPALRRFLAELEKKLGDLADLEDLPE